MSVIELNGEQDVKDFLMRGVVIVDFWAPWCSPCKAMAPSFEKVSEEMKSKLSFGKVDVEAHSALGSEYGIQSIPCLIVFKDGKEKDRIIGAQNEEALKEKIENILAA